MRYLWLLSVLLPLAAQAETYITAENNGCKILNPNPQQDETATWSGTCDSEGYAEGQGKVEWLIGGEPLSWSMGYYRRGKLEGLGRNILVEAGNPSDYRGQWLESMYHGYGVWESGKGSRYRGAFHKGAMHGFGILEGSIASYAGAWRDGKFHGWGMFRMVKEHPSIEKYAGKGQWEGKYYVVRGRFAEGKLIAVCNSEAECPPE